MTWIRRMWDQTRLLEAGRAPIDDAPGWCTVEVRIPGEGTHHVTAYRSGRRWRLPRNEWQALLRTYGRRASIVREAVITVAEAEEVDHAAG